jgi:2-dehydro-3-deoxyphosphogluconate aldolase/(4S)-4-hydroxy-2-oxoglutarate aldolase
MTSKKNILNQILHQGILPLYYNDDQEVTVGIMSAMYKAGLRVAEYTNRGEFAIDNYLFLQHYAKNQLPGMTVGIGTIKTKSEAEIFISTGAEFVICPVVDIAVAQVVQKAGLLWIPGCMTATEINLAQEHGATLVKIFPGNILGPSFIASVKEVFPDLLFMPTGGVEVSKQNFGAWYDAGASALGLGSKLVTKSIMATKDYDKLTQDARLALTLARELRK